MRQTLAKRIVVGLLLAVVVVGVWMFRPGGPGWPRGHAMYGRVIEVRGRLVRQGDGAPVAGVCVLALGYEVDASGVEEELEWVRPFLASQAATPEDARATPYAQSCGLSDADGRFSVRYAQTRCVGITRGDPEPDLSWVDREGLYGLVVDRAGEAPWVLTPPPMGTWLPVANDRDRPTDTGSGPACVWNLGDIVVPK